MRITQPRYQEVYHETILDNGLKVVIFEKPGYVSTACYLATPFGGVNQQVETPDGIQTFHSGLAHFLEHKMFESSEQQDVMVAFTAMGCNVNAFTSYHETVYYFSTANPQVQEPLNLLLDFVQQFTVSEASVEKEKGIIVSEYRMYQQSPESRLFHETFNALYHEFPLKHDISGDEANINAITKAELELCHQINYHPSNMVLVIVSGLPAEDLLKIVQDNQQAKSFVKMPHIRKVYPVEPTTVAKPLSNVTMNLQQPKFSLAYKLTPSAFTLRETIKIDILWKLFMEANFSAYHPAYQQWLDDEIINDYFDGEGEFNQDYAYLIMAGDYLSPDVHQTLHDHLVTCLNQPFDNQLLQQLKNKTLGRMLLSLNSLDETAINYLQANWHQITPFTMMEILEDLTIEDFKQLPSTIDLNQKVEVVLQ